MSFYNKSSLLTIPTAYKQGKLYSVKPDDGSGDFTFTRSTSATRVNEAGLIEKERENLLLQSNTFNTTWTTSQASLTGGQTGYDGSNDGWLLESTVTGSSFVRQLVDVSSSVSTLSIYAKSGNVDWCYINAVGVIAYYDLSNGIVGTTAGTNLIDTNIESVGNGWYRISITGLDISEERIYPATTNGNPYSAVGDNIYIQDAQLEAGLVATDYIETTTSTVATGITTNVPRIDYSSGTPALLLEPQRTNLIRYSEIFEGYSTGYWQTFDNGTIETNYGISPQGIQNSTKIGTSGGNNDFVYNSITVSIGTVYTTSCYVKNIDATKSLIYGVNSANNNLNWSGSQLVSIDNAEFEEVGNGWYRIWITSTAATSSNIFRIYSDRNVSAGSIEVYGFQVEQGSYPTSYIPTYGTSVTRTNDLCSVTNASLIGQSEGTLFFDIENIDDAAAYLGVDNGTNSTRIIIYPISNVLYCEIRNANITIAIFNAGTVSGQVKVSLSYNASESVLYVNGTQIGTRSGTTFTDLSTVTFNQGSQIGVKLKQALVFKTKLSNTELATLTTI